MGGSWQETTAGSGSYFVFNINLRRSEKAERPAAASTLIKGMPSDQPRKEMKDLSILLVEDNPINQRITQLMLEPLVKRIEIARNGKEALDMFGTSRYDLILMDVQMPDMDGLEATREIRSDDRARGGHTPVIAMTAHAMKGDRERCLEAGMDGYVAKPIRAQELADVIQRIVFDRESTVPARPTGQTE